VKTGELSGTCCVLFVPASAVKKKKQQQH